MARRPPRLPRVLILAAVTAVVPARIKAARPSRCHARVLRPEALEVGIQPASSCASDMRPAAASVRSSSWLARQPSAASPGRAARQRAPKSCLSIAASFSRRTRAISWSGHPGQAPGLPSVRSRPAGGPAAGPRQRVAGQRADPHRTRPRPDGRAAAGATAGAPGSGPRPTAPAAPRTRCLVDNAERTCRAYAVWRADAAHAARSRAPSCRRRELVVRGRRLRAPADDLLVLLPHRLQADPQRLQRPAAMPRPPGSGPAGGARCRCSRDRASWLLPAPAPQPGAPAR